MRLDENEFVVTAWAAPARGPGWSNTPVMVLIQQEGGGGFRIEYLQPDEQSEGIHILYGASAVVSSSMLREVEYMMRKAKAKS